MVGLSASELQAETLFPGDTIEYFSMAFVAGDPRGHRVAKVLRVDHQNYEFPVEVDTQEMLPLTIMLKRKRNRNDTEILPKDAKWRKLRTFRLVDGEVEGETRADRLNAGLKKSLSDALKSTKKALASEQQRNSKARRKKLMEKFVTKSHAALLDEGRTHSKFKYDSEKHESRKRKRSASTLARPKKGDTTPWTTQKSTSKFFAGKQEKSRPKMRISTSLSKFMKHVQETEDIDKRKRTVWGLDEYFSLDKKQKEMEAESTGGRAHTRESSSHHAVNTEKTAWKQQRKKYRETNGGPGALRSWLTTPSNYKRQGIDSPLRTQRREPRVLNLAPDEPKVSMMNKQNSLSFIMSNGSGGAPSRTKETNTSKQYLVLKHGDQRGKT